MVCRAYVADNQLFMVSLLDDDTDYIRRVWFFDTLEEAEDYVQWWNDTAVDETVDASGYDDVIALIFREDCM